MKDDFQQILANFFTIDKFPVAESDGVIDGIIGVGMTLEDNGTIVLGSIHTPAEGESRTGVRAKGVHEVERIECTTGDAGEGKVKLAFSM